MAMTAYFKAMRQRCMVEINQEGAYSIKTKKQWCFVFLGSAQPNGQDTQDERAALIALINQKNLRRGFSAMQVQLI